MQFYELSAVPLKQLPFVTVTHEGKWYKYETLLTQLLFTAMISNDWLATDNDKSTREAMPHPRTNVMDAKTTRRTTKFIFASFITTALFENVNEGSRQWDKQYCSNGWYS